VFGVWKRDAEGAAQDLEQETRDEYPNELLPTPPRFENISSKCRQILLGILQEAFKIFIVPTR
jgi:hypothetical protein